GAEAERGQAVKARAGTDVDDALAGEVASAEEAPEVADGRGDLRLADLLRVARPVLAERERTVTRRGRSGVHTHGTLVPPPGLWEYRRARSQAIFVPRATIARQRERPRTSAKASRCPRAQASTEKSAATPTRPSAPRRSATASSRRRPRIAFPRTSRSPTATSTLSRPSRATS